MTVTPKEILEKCCSLEVCEKRHIGDDYCEVVLFIEEKKELNGILTDILGPAVKPTGVRPTKYQLHLTADYGGIRTDQKLFQKEFDNDTVIAMEWPWKDGIHVTLKLAILKDLKPAPAAGRFGTGLKKILKRLNLQ